MRVLINYTNIKTARNSCTSTYCQLLFVSYVRDCCTNLHFLFITIRWLFERTHSGHRSGNENESYEAWMFSSISKWNEFKRQFRLATVNNSNRLYKYTITFLYYKLWSCFFFINKNQLNLHRYSIGIVQYTLLGITLKLLVRSRNN